MQIDFFIKINFPAEIKAGKFFIYIKTYNFSKKMLLLDGAVIV